MTRRGTEHERVDSGLDRALPYGMRVAGAWSWRIIVILAVLAALIYLVILLKEAVVPLLVAILLSSLLTPFKNLLIRRGLPKGIAVAIAFVALLVGVAGLVVLVVLTVKSGYSDFETTAVNKYNEVLKALKTSPLGISDADVKSFFTTVTKDIQSNSGSVLTGALSAGTTVGHILIGLVLSLFITLFFLIDGPGIWNWCVRLAPKNARAAVDGAGRAGWISVSQYSRVQVLVAFIDAVGIGLGATILGLPFAVPIAVLVFLGAFIPFVGAVVTGGLAVVVALVYQSPFIALVMLAIVILVNQLESHVLQPLLMGGAVRLHPIAVVLAVTIGSVVGGIVGAVFAVPLTAALNSIVRYIAGGAWKTDPPPPPSRGIRGRMRPPDTDTEPDDVTTVA